MSAGGPDLFVICKNCGSEVSPYITECPYCGNRLRKRAPKIDKHGRIADRASRRPPTPSLSRLRRGEIPGIRHDAHPYATMLLVALGLLGSLLWRVGELDPHNLIIFGPLNGHWWRTVSALFIYDNGGYTFVALGIVALYGTLMERRHGPLMPILLFLIGGAVGMAVAGEAAIAPFFLGGNGGALALLVAWSVPDLLRLLEKHEFDGDLIGTAVIGAVMALMPLADPLASWLAGGVGAAIGLLFGYLLARLRPSLICEPEPVSFTDAELDAAVTAISDPGRLSAAQNVVTRAAPGLQKVLAGALHEGGWFDTAHTAAVKEALSIEDPEQRLTAIRTLFAEETRLSMLVGVAVGFELARELNYVEPGSTAAGTTSDSSTDRKDQ